MRASFLVSGTHEKPCSQDLDVRSGILDYRNPSRALHHLVASAGNISLHFPKLREQANLTALQQKQETAREAALQKKAGETSPFGGLPEKLFMGRWSLRPNDWELVW